MWKNRHSLGYWGRSQLLPNACLLLATSPVCSSSACPWPDGYVSLVDSLLHVIFPKLLENPTALILRTIIMMALVTALFFKLHIFSLLFILEPGGFWAMTFLFLLNLLGWHWLIKLYRFQMYKSIKHIICILCCVLTTPSQVSFQN